MRRSLLPPLALAFALAACGGREVALPTASPAPPASPSPARPTPSVTTASPTSEPSPSPTPPLALPPDAPTVLAEDLDPEALAAARYASLLPEGAAPLGARVAEEPVPQIALAWYRGEDPFARESGFVLWQRLPGDAPWRAVYGFTDRPARGVLGISVELAELTGDGWPDLLVREDTGGTGACATWRVVASSQGGAQELWRHTACDTEVQAARGRLLVREAVYGPEDPHCCPSGLRVRTLAFDGTTFVQVRVREADLEA